MEFSMEELITIDIDGNECHFQYEIDEDKKTYPDEITFRVYNIPMDKNRFFLYTFKLIDENTAKGEMMDANKCDEFKKKGIPERIIEKASSYLKCNIISSPRIHQPGNFLVDPSHKAWERLTKQNNNAIKDEQNKCFILNYRSD